MSTLRLPASDAAPPRTRPSPSPSPRRPRSGRRLRDALRLSSPSGPPPRPRSGGPAPRTTPRPTAITGRSGRRWSTDSRRTNRRPSRRTRRDDGRSSTPRPRARRRPQGRIRPGRSRKLASEFDAAREKARGDHAKAKARATADFEAGEKQAAAGYATARKPVDDAARIVGSMQARLARMYEDYRHFGLPGPPMAPTHVQGAQKAEDPLGQAVRPPPQAGAEHRPPRRAGDPEVDEGPPIRLDLRRPAGDPGRPPDPLDGARRRDRGGGWSSRSGAASSSRSSSTRSRAEVQVSKVLLPPVPVAGRNADFLVREVPCRAADERLKQEKASRGLGP